MLGSVFSPFYFKARAKNPAAAALEHCSMNVALYAQDRHLWAMTERASPSVARDQHSLSIGPSTMERRASSLVVNFDEMTSPFPSPFPERLKGSVTIQSDGFLPYGFSLDAAERHRWTPLAPACRAEVRLSHPSLSFSGHAYVDANAGAEPLEKAFRQWSWSRASHGKNGASITYEIERADGSHKLIAKYIGPKGEISDLPPLSPAQLGRTRWGLGREIWVDQNTRPERIRTLEDTPFYSRSMARARFGGQWGSLVHEYLSLERFTSPWVQLLLPYRMKQAAR